MSSSEKTIERLTKTIEAMSNELALLREQVACLYYKKSNIIAGFRVSRR